MEDRVSQSILGPTQPDREITQRIDNKAILKSNTTRRSIFPGSVVPLAPALASRGERWYVHLAEPVHLHSYKLCVPHLYMSRHQEQIQTE